MPEAAKEFLDAVRIGDSAKVNLLIDREPVLVDTRTEKGVSSVVFALYNGKREIAELLARRKHELDLYEASSIGYVNDVKTITQRDPTLVNSFSPDGHTPLGLASFLGHKEVVEHLLQEGAEVNAVSRNETGFTALTGAVAGGHVSIAKLLLEKRANVNYRYEEGFAPLMAAAEDGSVEMVELLLAHGADVNARANDGKTALAFAAARNHHDVFELLKSYGAKE